MTRHISTDRPDPLLLNSWQDVTSLKRVPLGSPAFDEKKLQELLRCHPHLLPIQQLAPGFAPAICIGREVRLEGVGALDNLYISPNGGLTLVETKLWKNPEARREVVAQLFDYTKQIAQWDYKQLAAKAEDYLKEYEKWDKSLYDWLEEKFEDIPSEQEFIDRTNDDLQHGRFLLLIVGDGIRRGTEEMVSYIQQTPQLQFRLALVEMSCYRPQEKDWPLVLVPHLIVKTAEIERSVVRIEMSNEAKQRVAVTITMPPTGTTVDPSEEGFFSDLAHAIPPQATEKVRQFVQNMSKLREGMEINIAKQLGITWNFEYDDTSEALRLLLIARRGQMQARLLRHADKGNPLVPDRLIDSFWDKLGKVHPSLQPTTDKQGKLRHPGCQYASSPTSSTRWWQQSRSSS